MRAWQFSLASMFLVTAVVAAAVWVLVSHITTATAYVFFALSISGPCLIALGALRASPESRGFWIGALFPAIGAMFLYLCALGIQIPSVTYDPSALELVALRLQRALGFQRQVVALMWVSVPVLAVITD